MEKAVKFLIILVIIKIILSLFVLYQLYLIGENIQESNRNYRPEINNEKIPVIISNGSDIFEKDGYLYYNIP